MKKVRIQVTDNEPFLVSGEVDYLDGKGNKIITTSAGYLCRCGKSTKKPYCSGACKGSFNNQVRKA